MGKERNSKSESLGGPDENNNPTKNDTASQRSTSLRSKEFTNVHTKLFFTNTEEMDDAELIGLLDQLQCKKCGVVFHKAGTFLDKQVELIFLYTKVERNSYYVFKDFLPLIDFFVRNII